MALVLIGLCSACAVKPRTSRPQRSNYPTIIAPTLASVMRSPSSDPRAEIAALQRASRSQPGSRLRRAFLMTHVGEPGEAIVELNLVIHGSTAPTPPVEALARALRAQALRRVGKRDLALHDEAVARQLSHDPDLLALLAPETRRPGQVAAPRLADLDIQPRSAWNARSPRRSGLDPMGTIRRLTVHHSATAIRSPSRSQAIASIRAIQMGHQKRGFADIGYHYIIDPAGRIWEGRPSQFLGAHVRRANSNNLGVCLLGDLRPRKSGAPSPEQTAALERLLLALMDQHGLTASSVQTHGEVGRGTECPGPFLARHIDDFRARLRSGLALGE
ncbi:MAG: peptidoglycan recognition family protein [Planctomycetota bacterium]